MSTMRVGRRLCAAVLVMLAAGCSTYRPAWTNAPLERIDPAVGYRLESDSVTAGNEALTVVLTFSGGGTRAAAFAYGVLKELDRTPIRWRGADRTLFEEVDLVSGVSGGSVTAAYYAAFGHEIFERFEPESLHRDFEGGFFTRMFAPPRLWRLTSPWYGRSHVLAEEFDHLFRGRTYGDLLARGGTPYLLITANDLAIGADFPFTQEHFDLLCSDLASVPLSFAVASSSAVPLLLSPTMVRNHAGQCTGGGRVRQARAGQPVRQSPHGQRAGGSESWHRDARPGARGAAGHRRDG